MAFLDKLKRGRVASTTKLLIYGPPGVGKSSFAAGAPSPVFIDCEKRTDHLDVARLQPDSWDEVLGAMRELVADSKGFKTVVVDTLDHAELLIHKHVCAANGWATIEDPSYGKGYAPAMLEWQRFLVGCDMLRSKGLTVVLLAHSSLRTLNNPSGDSYDVFSLKMKGGQKTNSGDLIRERMDLVGFAHFEDVLKKSSKTDPNQRPKAITTGNRLLAFGHNPAFETKQGIPAKAEIPLSWQAFEAMMAELNPPQEKHNG